ncbi:MAG: hypothetical protein Q8T04_01105 [Bacteroidota bacterium]|nr:hypothetical protein [Bacteroidota bacterium]
MNTKLSILLIITALFLSGCSEKFYNFLYYDQELHGIQIAGKITNIDVIDLRQKDLLKDIEIPKSQFSNYDIIAHPALTNKNKELLERKVRSYFTNSGKSLKVKCYIVNTAKRATRTIFKLREFVLVEMSIAIFDENDKLLDFGTSSSSYEHKPVGSIKYEINLLFEKAIRDAVYRCFDEFKSIEKTITVGGAFRYSVIKKED